MSLTSFLGLDDAINKPVKELLDGITVGQALDNVEGFANFMFSRFADLLVGPQNGVVTKLQPTLDSVKRLADSATRFIDSVSIRAGK